MSTPTPRVRVPSKAKKGEIIEIKTLISHEMESGQRKDSVGKAIPRKIIKAFSATYNGKEVFSSDWHPAISANPYLAFFCRIDEAGTFEFKWLDDDGSVYKATAKVELS
jgi:sulfur-oxidizing protein SoxZ